jgi:Tfp pilus assembly protein PilO
MNPNELAKLKKQSWLPIVLIGVMLMLPSYSTEPQFEELASAEGRVDGSLAKGRALLKERRENQELKARFETLEQELEGVEARLPNIDELPDVIDELQSKANEAQVSIENVVYQFGDSYGELAIPSYQLNMMVQGKYESLKEFLRKIENNKKPIIIDEIVLASNRHSYTVKVRVVTK